MNPESHLEVSKLLYSFSSDYCFILNEKKEVIWANETIRNEFTDSFLENIFNNNLNFNKIEKLCIDKNGVQKYILWKKNEFPAIKNSLLMD